MKKITPVLVGLVLSASASAMERDLSQKFYAGINVGGFFVTLSTNAKTFETNNAVSFKKNSVAGDIHLGRRFGAFGLELSAGMLDKMTVTTAGNAVTLKSVDYVVALDLGYYMPLAYEISLRPSVGIGGIWSQNTVTTSTIGGLAALESFADTESLMGYTKADAKVLPAGKSSKSKMTLAPRAGLALSYAAHQNVSLTAGANFIWAVKNDHLKYVVNALVGVNYHF